jgi:hypothetical protein
MNASTQKSTFRSKTKSERHSTPPSELKADSAWSFKSNLVYTARAPGAPEGYPTASLDNTLSERAEHVIAQAKARLLAKKVGLSRSYDDSSSDDEDSNDYVRAGSASSLPSGLHSNYGDEDFNKDIAEVDALLAGIETDSPEQPAQRHGGRSGVTYLDSHNPNISYADDQDFAAEDEEMMGSTRNSYLGASDSDSDTGANSGSGGVEAYDMDTEERDIDEFMRSRGYDFRSSTDMPDSDSQTQGSGGDCNSDSDGSNWSIPLSDIDVSDSGSCTTSDDGGDSGGEGFSSVFENLSESSEGSGDEAVNAATGPGSAYDSSDDSDGEDSITHPWRVKPEKAAPTKAIPPRSKDGILVDMLSSAFRHAAVSL